ncbi:MAG: DNA polymerase domain-containing protein [Candidatus Binatia bacterium]|nr:MAG: DNA polymerase domain-containing protein [Candidatus Binatia bacterium]
MRYPDGIGGKSFFQKQVPEFVPAWVGRCRIEDTEFFVCNELEELLYVVNLGCIPIHLWSSRCSDPQRPDWVVLDLDPKGAPFRNVVRIARALHGLCEALGIPHFAKTSGQEGLHVLLPSGGVLSHDEARTFAELLARLVVRSCGEIATLERSVERREGKVYVDYLQNGFGKTIVAPFSLRARPGAPVSAPLRWNEVRPGLDPLRYSLRSIPRRVARIGDPMADLLRSRPDWRGILGELSKRLEEDRST